MKPLGKHSIEELPIEYVSRNYRGEMCGRRQAFLVSIECNVDQASHLEFDRLDLRIQFRDPGRSNSGRRQIFDRAIEPQEWVCRTGGT